MPIDPAIPMLRFPSRLLLSLALLAILACGSGSSEATVGSGGANTPPVAADKVVRLHNSRHPFSISLPAVDAEGDPCAFEIVQAPSHGTYWRLSAARIAEAPQRMHRILYTPAEGYVGTDAFTFRLTDAQGAAGNLATVTLEVLAPLAQEWVPPLGIPKPEFGIEESHRMYTDQLYDYDQDGTPEAPYGDAGAGPFSHYLDNTHASATDADNPYGTPSRPRLTFPYELPAGSVVEVHGGPYAFRNLTDKMAILSRGTARRPVFLRGASAAARPVLSKDLHVRGSYLICEHLSFINAAGFSTRKTLTSTYVGSDHIAIRHSELQGNGTETGNFSVIAFGEDIVDPEHPVTDVVAYANQVHHHGQIDPNAENDTIGVCSNRYDVYYSWIVDNDIHHMSGDSIRVGANPSGALRSSSQYAFVGRNHCHDNGENALDVKTMEYVVASQNDMHGFRGLSAGDAGCAIPVHYDPDQVWILFNTLHDSNQGVACSGVQRLFLVGNVFHDLHDASEYEGDALRFWGRGDTIEIVNNTMVRVDNGVNYRGGLSVGYPVVGNLIAELNDPARGEFIHYAGTGQSAASEMSHNLLFNIGGTFRIEWAGLHTSLAAFQAATGKGTGCLNANPQFVNTDNFDLAPGSPASETGLEHGVYQRFQDTFGLNIRRDFSGAPRPGTGPWSMGAWE